MTARSNTAYNAIVASISAIPSTGVSSCTNFGPFAVTTLQNGTSFCLLSANQCGRGSS